MMYYNNTISVEEVADFIACDQWDTVAFTTTETVPQKEKRLTIALYSPTFRVEWLYRAEPVNVGWRKVYEGPDMHEAVLHYNELG